MGKIMSSSELLTHCKNAVEVLCDALEQACSDIPKWQKRAMLLGYWIKTYIHYWKNEDSFSPQSVYRLKRGSVVFVEFGYRVRRELGGRHFAVVIDANNALNGDTVTVVPLSSKKESWTENLYEISLEKGFYEKIQENIAVGKAQSSTFHAERLKAGSIAKVGQIITISKMRILAPRKKTDPLFGVRLASQDMCKIDRRLEELYFFHKDDA